MAETLESSTIRHLILKARLTRGGSGGSFHISDIVRAVCDAAVADGLLQSAPHLEYQSPLADKITEVIWDLIIEGVYTPGDGMQSPNLPRLRVTEYGRRCFDAGELTPHDPGDYLRRLTTACSGIDEITLLYIGEALDTFRSGKYLASTVMVGVAAEKMLFRLVEAVHAALSTPERQEKFERGTKEKQAKTQHHEVLVRLRSPATPLPRNLESVLTQDVDGAYDLIRRTRNEAGHPTGKKMERDETHALLLLFPVYCKTVHALIEWLRNHQV